MNFEEHAAKPLLAAAGIPVPAGRLATTPEAAMAAARELGRCVVKAQVPVGKRGKAGGIRVVDEAADAGVAAEAILGMQIGGHPVERVLVEQRANIAREFYAAVLNDSASKGPLLMFSTQGGMDIEEAARDYPHCLCRMEVDIRAGPDRAEVAERLAALGLGDATSRVAELLMKLYATYRAHDAELLEVNPLAQLDDGELLALDCKLVLDDSGVARQAEIAASGSHEQSSPLEERARALGLKYIELDGEIAVLANGAGLTMTTMDVISHYGGRPANFLEIGGAAYTLATPALELVLANPRVRSLVVNFCGAFARTDVMTAGVIDAWQSLAPEIPVFFSVRGTGSAEAVSMLRERLAVEPYESMDAAIRAAIDALPGSQ